MNRKIINRIMDKRTIITYFVVFLLLFTVTSGQKSVLNILGGFSPQESRGLDIIGIMRWNLCVLPPVAASILFMDVEMGVLRFYTMIRVKTIKKWFLSRFMCIVAANLLYLLLFAVLAEICARNGDYKRNGFLLFLILFFMHSFLMSAVSVALCAQSKGVHMSIVYYLTVEGIMVVIGDIFPQTAAYLPPYWGMIRQVGESCDRGYLLTIMGFSVVVIVGSVIFIIKGLGHNKRTG